MNRKHFSVYFKLWQQTYRRLKLCEDNRLKGSYGILVDNDEYAVRYRSFRMRLEILELYLKNTTPNWIYATYLTTDEAIARNESYPRKLKEIDEVVEPFD